MVTDKSKWVGYLVSYCTNSTENGNWCKSKDEADKWIGNHNHYLAH